MPNFIQKNMGMITMVAAVITALILALPMIGIQLPTREGGNEALACAMTAGSNMVGFDVSQCAMFEMMYADCSPSSGTILVTQGSYKDQSFNTDGVCNLNDKANNRMYFEGLGPFPQVGHEACFASVFGKPYYKGSYPAVMDLVTCDSFLESVMPLPYRTCKIVPLTQRTMTVPLDGLIYGLEYDYWCYMSIGGFNLDLHRGVITSMTPIP